jgi:hypothetical protein
MPQTQSKVDICNLALANVNVKPILTLGDANEAARMVNRWYEPMRRELLEDCDWSFARKTFNLNLIGQLPGLESFPDWASSGSSEEESNNVTEGNAVFPWAYLYAYPANVLYIHKVYSEFALATALTWDSSSGVQFRSWLEGLEKGWEILRSKKTNELAVATNIQSAICKYTANITDVSQFTAKFATALSFKISQRICLPLTGDKELKQMVDEDLSKAMTDAMRNNLSESPEYGPRTSSYEDVRG